MDEKTNKELVALQKHIANVINGDKQKSYRVHGKPFPERTEKMNWTELRLKYLDSLVQVEKPNLNVDLDETLSNLINRLNENLIDGK